MAMSGRQLRKVALLSSQLFDNLLVGEAASLPHGAPAYLKHVLSLAQRAAGDVLSDERRLQVFGETLEIFTPRAFAEAIRKAETGNRLGDAADEFLFDVETNGGNKIAVSFDSGTDMMADTLFQVAGVGRRRDSQAARQRENARREAQGTERDEGQSSSQRAEERTPAVSERKAQADTRQHLGRTGVRGSLEALLRAIKEEAR